MIDRAFTLMMILVAVAIVILARITRPLLRLAAWLVGHAGRGLG